MRLVLVGLTLSLVLAGCAAAPRPDAVSPADEVGLARGEAKPRIHVDVEDVDLRALAEHVARVHPELAELQRLAGEEDTVGLPELARWLGDRLGRTVLVDPSAAHVRVDRLDVVLALVGSGSYPRPTLGREDTGQLR